MTIFNATTGLSMACRDLTWQNHECALDCNMSSDFTAYGTSYFRYIGDAADPKFEWPPSDAVRNGNLPKRVYPVDFTDIRTDIALSEFEALAAAYGGDTMQIDWGAWGLRLTGTAMLALLAERLRDKSQLADIAAHLQPDRTYVLIIGEAY